MSNKWLCQCRGWDCFLVINVYDRSFEHYIKTKVFGTICDKSLQTIFLGLTPHKVVEVWIMRFI